MKKYVYSVFAAVMAASMVSGAASKQLFCDTQLKDMKTCKNIPQNRREELGKKIEGGNPVAITNEKGELKVWYTTGHGLLDCAVTTEVQFFKMSQNSKDVSTAYFVRKGHLMDVQMDGSVEKSCPKAVKQDYSEMLGLENDPIAELKVVSNSNSVITAVARTQSGYVIKSTDTKIEKEYHGFYAPSIVEELVK